MKIKYLLLKFATLLLLLLARPGLAAPTLSVAIVPQFSPEQIYQAWHPVLTEVTKITGVNLVLKSFDSIPEFEAAFLKGEADLLYMNPYHAVMAHQAQGYIPIIRDAAQRLTGILVVRKDSPLTRVQQLDGSTLAFPSPNAFGASLYMRALLSEREKISYTPSYVQTHSNVYRQVIAGRVAAGGGVQHTLDKEPEEVQALLRVIYTTPPAYPHPLAVHPRVPAKVRDSLQAAFLKLGKQPSFSSALKEIQIPDPAKAVYNDYAPLQQLGIERFLILK